MSPWLDYDSLCVSVLCIMGPEYPFICVIRRDRLNNDKWSAEPEFTRRLVNIILFPEQVSSALIRSLPELFESYRQHTKKINFPVSLLVLSKSCYPYSQSNSTILARNAAAFLLSLTKTSNV